MAVSYQEEVPGGAAEVREGAAEEGGSWEQMSDPGEGAAEEQGGL